MTIDPTASLLAQVFPSSRISRLDYLRWLYLDSPHGAVIEANLDDEQGRAGHYAVVPLELSIDGATRPAALSLNTAVHERARGGGVFTRLATESFERACERGVEAIVGVANANSTPGFLRRLEFELLMQLPATVLAPIPGRTRGLRSGWADDPAVVDAALAGAGPLLAAPQHGLSRRWTEQTLRWRLAAPGSRYALHRSERALVVTTADSRHGLAVAIVLAVFAAVPLSGGELRALVRRACRFHRAPLALHVGVNANAGFSGIPLPERFREAPLNLIHRNLAGDERRTDVSRFEFLDFDAY